MLHTHPVPSDDQQFECPATRQRYSKQEYRNFSECCTCCQQQARRLVPLVNPSEQEQWPDPNAHVAD